VGKGGEVRGSKAGIILAGEIRPAKILDGGGGAVDDEARARQRLEDRRERLAASRTVRKESA
jgi:hypothetical protein